MKLFIAKQQGFWSERVCLVKAENEEDAIVKMRSVYAGPHKVEITLLQNYILEDRDVVEIAYCEG